MNRDDFSEPVKRILAARVGHICSRPECRATTSGPQFMPNAAVNVGVAAHITAASPQGPRYQATLSPEERSSPDNGIWLCQNCAKLVDNDDQRFTIELLRAWKIAAEQHASERVGKTSSNSPESSEAKSGFRCVLSDTLADLRAGDIDAFHLLSQSKQDHDRAILRFREYVPAEILQQYDHSVEHFKATRANTQPAMISFYEQQATGKCSGSTREEAVAAIEQLLAFARG